MSCDGQRKRRKGGEREIGLFGFGAVVVFAAAVIWLSAQILSLFSSAEAMTGPGRYVAYTFAWGAVALVWGLTVWGLVKFGRLPKAPVVKAADFAEDPQGFQSLVLRPRPRQARPRGVPRS